MGGDDYVIDDKRNKAWATTYEAMQWYRAELERVESLYEETLASCTFTADHD